MTDAPPFNVGAQRVVLGITFTFEPTPPSDQTYKPAWRWRGWPLAHDVYVFHHPRDGWLLRVAGVVHAIGALDVVMHKAVQRRVEEVSKARADVATYDAALQNLRVQGVLVAAQQVFPKSDLIKRDEWQQNKKDYPDDQK